MTTNDKPTGQIAEKYDRLKNGQPSEGAKGEAVRGLVFAPWTKEQVAALNEWQKGEMWHPFTCGADDCRQVLVADRAGWFCPDCEYTQQWAHDFMADATKHPKLPRFASPAPAPTEQGECDHDYVRHSAKGLACSLCGHGIFATIADLRQQLAARDEEAATTQRYVERIVGENDGLEAECERLRRERDEAQAKIERVREIAKLIDCEPYSNRTRRAARELLDGLCRH